MPIAPTVDADTFPELAQRPTTSTVVILDGAPEDPISKPDGTESSSGTDSDAEDTNCVGSSVASKSVKKKKMKQTTRPFWGERCSTRPNRNWSTIYSIHDRSDG
ncbi:hypothetical protein DAPPUDRAFT_258380 [Daphnia pulex]|uniref:Uncharacterized protein n=1 Tax=Daphnia pulex TaxID=6669 RepID=E9HF97_DAPPU|nr:hypothetical protein DAPPUDRAFT_258380 [Daphnia pulex]|eukprot:EFX69571.1 hypothetical protein DAPPUDRAFT_258380 [Daphnia pulex]